MGNCNTQSVYAGSTRTVFSGQLSLQRLFVTKKGCHEKGCVGLPFTSGTRWRTLTSRASGSVKIIWIHSQISCVLHEW